MSTGQVNMEATPSDHHRPEEQPERGVLSFVDNAVDTTTGTIQMKGTFPNKERRLWPGQFVNLVLTLGIRPDAVLVPTNAIQTGQDGQFVFVINSDLSVESRPVVADGTFRDETIVGKGLSPGETVVTEGQLQLVSGTKVEIKKSALTVSGEGRPQ